MTGQSGAFRSRATGSAVGDRITGSTHGRLTRASSTPGTTGGDHDLVGIRDGRINELHLGPDHRMDARLPGRGCEADRAIETGMVRGGQSGEPQLYRSGDQLVRCRRSIEEREVGMGVKFRVRDGTLSCHWSTPIGGRWRRPTIIEQTFYRYQMKHFQAARRLRGVHATFHLHRPFRPVALIALRTALSVALAMLLILVLLPALIAAQAAAI